MGNLNFLHGGNIYEAKRKYKKGVVDFSANINPLGPPQKVKKAILKNFDSIVHYPDPEAKNITERIAHYWRIKEENILVGNGSAELIYLVVLTYRPKIVSIPTPTFSEYERAAKNIGARCSFLKLKEKYGFNLDGLSFGKIDVLFACNPNNPTGNLIFQNRKIDEFPKELLIVDEAFMDFLPDEKNHTFIWEAVKEKKIIVLRTFTKFFALPGLRLGYLVAHREVINKIRQHQSPWSVNCFVQLAAEVILDDKEYIRETYSLVRKERRYLFNQIIKIKGLRPYPSVANFLLIKIEDKNLTSSLLTKKLLERGILVRDCVNFRGLGNRFIRMAVRLHKENLSLLRFLREIA